MSSVMFTEVDISWKHNTESGQNQWAAPLKGLVWVCISNKKTSAVAGLLFLLAAHYANAEKEDISEEKVTEEDIEDWEIFDYVTVAVEAVDVRGDILFIVFSLCSDYVTYLNKCDGVVVISTI